MSNAASVRDDKAAPTTQKQIAGKSNPFASLANGLRKIAQSKSSKETKVTNKSSDVKAKLKQSDKQKLRDGIIQTARRLGISPKDLATAISYETGGTFDPTKKGPTTQWGQHRGLIQFGEPQARKYGVDWNKPIESQLGPNGAVERYLRDAGVKPGMGLLEVYSAINAGGVSKSDMKKSDSKAGGMPGSVIDKVNSKEMRNHAANAAKLLEGAPSFTGTTKVADAGDKPAVNPPSFKTPATRPDRKSPSISPSVAPSKAPAKTEPPKTVEPVTKPSSPVIVPSLTPSLPDVFRKMVANEPAFSIGTKIGKFFSNPNDGNAKEVIKETSNLIPGMSLITSLTDNGFNAPSLLQGFGNEIGGLPGRAITAGGIMTGGIMPDAPNYAPKQGMGNGVSSLTGGSQSSSVMGDRAKPLTTNENVETNVLPESNETFLQSLGWNIAIIVMSLSLLGFGIYSMLNSSEINVEVTK